jgi:hypothetical protein
MFSSLWQKCFDRGPRTFRRRPPPSRRCRPRLEALEGRCVPSTVTNLLDSGTGSLRDAIATTPAGGTVDFQPGLSGTITLTSGQLTVAKDLTVDGPGAGVIAVSGNNASRVFAIGATFTVDISGLTIANGKFGSTAGGGGGGILNAGTLTLTDSTLSGNSALGTLGSLGGGIYNTGTLTIAACTLSGNSASNAFTSSGGAIDNYQGTVTITASTLSGNTASGGRPTFGGAIANDQGTLTITASTLSGNSATSAGGGNGGGIYNTGTLTVTSSTLSGNSARTGGGIDNVGGTVSSRNTLLAGNTASTSPDIAGPLTSQGHNLIGDGSGGSGFSATDLVGTSANPIDPRLGPLQDNGGPTQTRAPLAGSPALDAGDSALLGTADQRGVARAGGVNIGAYQASATSFALTAPATAPAGTPFDVTVQAVDPFGQTALGYTGTVTFSTTDTNPAVVLPADHTFTAADAGVHTFPGEATLVSVGGQVLTATDAATSSLTGNAAVTVSPAAADHLLFLQQPTDTAAGQAITPALLVAVVDQFGNVVTADNSDTVTLAIGTNPGGGTLRGTRTVTVVNGVATFCDLSIDQAGDGYTLHATAGGSLPDIDSGPFRITA